MIDDLVMVMAMVMEMVMEMLKKFCMLDEWISRKRLRL